MQPNYLNYYQPRQPIYQQPQPQPTPIPQMYNYNAIKGFPVASIEEARAANIDFDGSVFIFPDLANQRIYTKNINQDGTLSFNIYELSGTDKKTGDDPTKFITRAQLDDALMKFKQDLMNTTGISLASEEKKVPLEMKF